ncbi:MAG: methyltransferase domain-containing protein [Candidatus Zixiibacteriota bacterium]
MHQNFLNILCCPACKGELQLKDAVESGGEIERGRLDCTGCAASYKIERGVAVLVGGALKAISEQSWLGPSEKKSKVGSQIWYLVSNGFGLLFSPLLALFGWALDFYIWIRQWESPIRIADVRGLTWFHLINKRPYQHLRMLEHALAMNIISKWQARSQAPIIVIDIGAEISLFCAYLARRGVQACGLDLDKTQMFWQQNLANQYRGKIKAPISFVVGSATELPFRNNSAYVTAISVIEHIEQDNVAFAEIGRVCGADHRAVISFLYQDFPVTESHREAAWKRAREHHPAYGASRDIDAVILRPANSEFAEQVYFWKKLCRATKGFVRTTKIFEHSMIFDYFIYVRLAKLEQCIFPGKQANIHKGRAQAFQWIFELAAKGKAS